MKRLRKLNYVSNAIKQQHDIHKSVMAVSAKWLSEETGIPIKRIYQFRADRDKKMSWVEYSSITSALKGLADKYDSILPDAKD